MNPSPKLPNCLIDELMWKSASSWSQLIKSACATTSECTGRGFAPESVYSKKSRKTGLPAFIPDGMVLLKSMSVLAGRPCANARDFTS